MHTENVTFVSITVMVQCECVVPIPCATKTEMSLPAFKDATFLPHGPAFFVPEWRK